MKTLVTIAALTLFTFASHAQDDGSPPSQAKADGKVTFRLSAKNAKECVLRGQWTKDPIAMKRADDGMWSVTIDAVPAGVWEYSFAADGLNVLDPSNPAFKPQREPQKSIVHVPSTPPAPWDWQDVPHGTVHQHGYLSKVLNKPREIWVYTPPEYERSGDKKFPLLVLQHGSGDNNQTWVAHGKAHWIFDNLIAQSKARPMIVVMLDGHPLGRTARGATPPRGPGSAMDAFQRELFEDALPLVESLYRVEKEPATRAIAGLSMGGGQSLTVGLGNLDRFAWIGAFSAAPPSEEIAKAVLADPAGVNGKLKLLWIGVGKDDFLRKRNEDFVAALKDKGVHHEWHLTDGDHSWPVWRRYLAELVPLLFTESK